MSNIFSNSGMSVADKQKKDASIYEEYLGSSVVSGTKYLGSRRGDASILDGSMAQDELERKKKAVGEGSYVIQYFGNDGTTPLRNHVVEVDGRAFTTDNNGKITYVDANWIDAEYENVRQVEEYVHKIAKMCRTNAILQKILGIPYDAMVGICKSGGGGGTDGIGIVDEAILNVNCLPSTMTMYPPNSMLEAQAYTKLITIIRKFMPAIKNKSETKKVNHIDKAPKRSMDSKEKEKDGAEGNE